MKTQNVTLHIGSKSEFIDLFYIKTKCKQLPNNPSKLSDKDIDGLFEERTKSIKDQLEFICDEESTSVSSYNELEFYVCKKQDNQFVMVPNKILIMIVEEVEEAPPTTPANIQDVPAPAISPSELESV